jgi:hypothetical protein
MRFIGAAVIAAAITGAFALGVWTGPSLRSTEVASASEARVVEPSPVLVETPRVVRTAAVRETEVRLVSMPITDGVLDRVKPLLNKGANIQIAADGFKDAEQFAAVAHAAKNTGTPFMVLKSRVLEDGRTLRAALQELRPGLNAAVEAQRAQAEARSDVAAVQAESTPM